MRTDELKKSPGGISTMPG